jgi:glucose 1-dehydrogenase
MRLAGKVAIVTGGGYGMGRGIARRLAAEGAKVALADVNAERNAETAELIREAGGEALPLPCDGTVRPQVQAMVDATVAGYGRLDILVSNAGIRETAHFLELTDESWHAVLDVNLHGVFLCGQIAARAMAVAGNGGKIVNIASIYAEVCARGYAAYCASKGGVRMLTKAMAIDLAEYGINVNAIAPGIIRTGMSEAGLETEAWLARYRALVPLGRPGEPDEIGRVALFLASPDSDYVTGVTIPVDGGWTVRSGSGRPIAPVRAMWQTAPGAS